MAGRYCGLVTYDNTRKELWSREKKSQINWVKFSHLQGRNFNQLLDKYVKDLERDEVTGQYPIPRISTSSLDKTLAVVVKPSPRYPTQSSGAIGWRSSLQEHNLEVFNRLYVTPKDTVINLTPGDLKNQKFIFLG